MCLLRTLVSANGTSRTVNFNFQLPALGQFRPHPKIIALNVSTSMQRDITPFIDLPPDILDTLSLSFVCGMVPTKSGSCGSSYSQTCKQLQLTADEHHVWLCQAKRLQIPIECGVTLSKVELKDRVISRAGVDVRWVKGRPWYLKRRLFHSEKRLTSAHYLPGGKFVVLLYATRSID